MWWEARIKLDPEEYEGYRALATRASEDGKRATRWEPERCEVLLTAESRDYLVAQAVLAIEHFDSAQVHMERRCYRTRNVPESPWAPSCECPPGTHREG